MCCLTGKAVRPSKQAALDLIAWLERGGKAAEGEMEPWRCSLELDIGPHWHIRRKRR